MFPFISQTFALQPPNGKSKTHKSKSKSKPSMLAINLSPICLLAESTESSFAFDYFLSQSSTCSLSSVAFFLSILSSPLEYPFFCHALPRKLMIGFTLLFFSMAATMLAFAVTILLVIRIEKKWTKSLLYSIAFFPVPLFGLLQFPMFQSFKYIYRKITKIFSPLLDFSKGVCGKDKAN